MSCPLGLSGHRPAFDDKDKDHDGDNGDDVDDVDDVDEDHGGVALW